MNKPTLFFSHSSKDKDMILSIKNKLMQYTSNTLEIFQSSDGESIPFGRNWIHRIEEGLNEAKVMFVFVTENSISSGWIYFEAGFAYSKGINVIPVGIGVNIGDLKAPLNLLQGFNITSGDCLNNFITIVNREFNYNFSGQFTVEDYSEIIAQSALNGDISHFDEVVRSVRYSLSGRYFENYSEKKFRETKNMFDRIKAYLDEYELDYSCTEPYENGADKRSYLAVGGIKFAYEPIRETPASGNFTVSISPYNFKKSFDLYLDIMSKCAENDRLYLQIRLKDNYICTTADEDCSALLSELPDWFSLSKKRVGTFCCNRLDLRFGINNAGTSLHPDYVLTIVYNPETVRATSIEELVSKLLEINIIHKATEETENA